MIKNYLLTALRNLKRHPGYSFINIAGLSIGMACFILIALIIRGEFQVDAFHERSDRIFRVIRLDEFGGESHKVAVTQAPLAAALKHDFPEVEKAACFNYHGQALIKYEDKTIKQDFISFAEPDFFEIFSYTFLAGTPASALRQPHSAVLTEEVAEKFFGTEDPIGKKMGHFKRDGVIIGVMKDYHFATLRDKIGPLVLDLDPQATNFVIIKVNPENLAATSAWIGQVWNGYDPDQTFEAKLLDEILKEEYFTEGIISRFFNYATYLSLLISCLGLFGLAAYSVEQRIKEVGIRKVFGASTTDIFSLLSKEHLKLIAISNIIAWPLGYFAMRKFLQNYPFRASLGIEIFLLSALAAFGIAFITVFSQTFKASQANPAEILKYE